MPNTAMQTYAAGIRAAKGLFLRALGEGLTPEQALHPLQPGSANILWLTAHLAYSTNATVLVANGGPSLVPDSWSKLFGIGSKADPTGTGYPSLEEAAAKFAEVADAGAALLESKDDLFLDEPLPPLLARMFTDRRRLIAIVPIHIGYHTGQISMLKKVQGLKAGIGV